MKLFFIIALGIAFGVALIPAAYRLVIWLGGLPRGVAALFRSSVVKAAFVGVLAVFGAGALFVLADGIGDDQSHPVESDGEGLERRERRTRDSLLACSDSALLAQRNYRDSVSQQISRDFLEPDRSEGDSAWVAWKRRVEERERPVSAIERCLREPRTCEDYRD